MYKPQRKRAEWVNIIKDKEDNNLTVDQICNMYNVSEASYIKWQGIFRKEKRNAPVTETDIVNLIKKSLAEFDANIKRIDEQVKNLAGVKADTLNKKAKLQDSLKTLTGGKLKAVLTPSEVLAQFEDQQ